MFVTFLILVIIQRDTVISVCFWRDSPPVGQGLLIHEVSKSQTTTHHSRQYSSGRVISCHNYTQMFVYVK